MKIFAGPFRNGITVVLTVLLLPVLGFGVAKAGLEVGDTIKLKVPDFAQFPVNPLEEHQFTCRAVTEHAYWLVQDTVSVEEGTGPGSPDSVVWGNIITQGELDTLTAMFEGGDVDIYGTVTGYLGEIPDTDGDPRLWIVMATMRGKYQNPEGNRRVMTYVNPADLDGSGSFNNHDIIYLNLHPFTDNETLLNKIAKEYRRLHLANGLGKFLRIATKLNANYWLTRGIGEVCQYLCFGVSGIDPNGYGIEYDLDAFADMAYIEMYNWNGSLLDMDYASTRGQAFLWLMYLAQREGDDIIPAIVHSDTTGVVNVARAIDPSVPDSIALETNVIPIYMDWLICNLISPLRSDMAGGIYTYEIFADPDGYQFGHMRSTKPFAGKFDDDDYPLGHWIPKDGMRAPIWAAQYLQFKENYPDHPTFYFNGAYADAGGSGPIINGKWDLMVVSVDVEDSTLVSIKKKVDLNDLYNGSFNLEEGNQAYLVITCNNPGGPSEPSDLKYVVSQDTKVPGVLTAIFQNSVIDRYLTMYTTLYDSIPESFDWYGPIFHASIGDSTVLVPMESFYGTLWNTRFNAWSSGDYTLEVAGYDSAGFYTSGSRTVAVGYVSSDGAKLEMQGVRLNVPAGAVTPGTMVSLCEAGLLDLAVNSKAPISETVDMMTGILAGPVSIPDVDGTLSFPAEDNRGAVYRYTTDGWTRLDSYFRGERMCALVSDGGIYAYGEAPGVRSPEIPAEFAFGGVYPNPSSSETAIRFSLPETGRVTVTVYDMSGRAVKTLTDTEMKAAEHTLIWDGTDESGKTVGAGVYFCRLRAAGQTVTQKMLRIE